MMSVHATLEIESCEVLGYVPNRIATRKYATAVVSSLLALQVGRKASDVECMTYDMGKKLQINQGGECKTASALMSPSIDNCVQLFFLSNKWFNYFNPVVPSIERDGVQFFGQILQTTKISINSKHYFLMDTSQSKLKSKN
jgi:hypothetical protein